LKKSIFTCVVQSRSHAISTTKSFLFAQKENKYFTTYRYMILWILPY